jgi:glycosyltransferase involved in cell wall biosynthesis
MSERPLITFALIAYNQEKFIEEAVQGAFSQVYNPLEIILSDDNSSDRTFEIMQELANSYKGPHKIILNRNEKNLGIGAHINRCMELSHGELVVAAAGDDISLPERTVEIYQAWIDSGMKSFSIDSEYEMIDEVGISFDGPSPHDLPKEQQLLHFSKTLVNYVIGSTHAWHRKVFDIFGPLPNITLEDVAIPPRSMLLGKVVRINKPLVKYRIHGNNIWESSKELTTQEIIDKNVYFLNDRLNVCKDVVRCIYEYKSTIKDYSQVLEIEKCISNICAGMKKLDLRIEILTGYPIIRLYSLLKYLYLYGFRRNDMIVVMCAISRTLYGLQIIMRYMFSAKKKDN